MTAAMLPSLQRVIASTIRGAFVADAASMGTHWIYNPQEVLEKITSREQPEFREPPSPNYYSSTEFPNHYMSGMLSPYGEQLLFVTQYTANTVGDDANAMTGPAMSTAMYEWATTFGGRPDHATTTFIENMKAKQMYPECGADDDQGMFFCLFFFLDEADMEMVLRDYEYRYSYMLCTCTTRFVTHTPRKFYLCSNIIQRIST